MALLEHGFRHDNLQQTLPISAILGFCEHTQWECRKREDEKLKEALNIFPRAMLSSRWIWDLFYAGLLHPLIFTQAVLLAVYSAFKENCCLISSYKILYSHHVRWTNFRITLLPTAVKKIKIKLQIKLSLKISWIQDKEKTKTGESKKNLLVINSSGLSSLVKQTYKQVSSRKKRYCLFIKS